MSRQEPSKQVRDYVMDDFAMKIDLPGIINEIANCSTNIPYRPVFNILRNALFILTKRATELHDPALDIIMLKLGLYEGSHDKNVLKVIEYLKSQIK